jgi:transcriptional regulator with XRE-family HTH domain
MGMSQLDVSKRADVPLLTVQGIEEGKIKDPKMTVIVKLARAIGYTVGNLIGTEIPDI